MIVDSVLSIVDYDFTLVDYDIIIVDYDFTYHNIIAFHIHSDCKDG